MIKKQKPTVMLPDAGSLTSPIGGKMGENEAHEIQNMKEELSRCQKDNEYLKERVDLLEKRSLQISEETSQRVSLLNYRIDKLERIEFDNPDNQNGEDKSISEFSMQDEIYAEMTPEQISEFVHQQKKQNKKNLKLISTLKKQLAKLALRSNNPSTQGNPQSNRDTITGTSLGADGGRTRGDDYGAQPVLINNVIPGKVGSLKASKAIEKLQFDLKNIQEAVDQSKDDIRVGSEIQRSIQSQLKDLVLERNSGYKTSALSENLKLAEPAEVSNIVVKELLNLKAQHETLFEKQIIFDEQILKAQNYNEDLAVQMKELQKTARIKERYEDRLTEIEDDLRALRRDLKQDIQNHLAIGYNSMQGKYNSMEFLKHIFNF